MNIQQNIPATFDDVVFENRNKLYGAYALRRSYNASLGKALGISALILLLLLLLGTRKWTKEDFIIIPPPGETVVEDYFEDPPVQPKKVEANTLPPAKPQEQLASKAPETFGPDGKDPEPLKQEPVNIGPTNQNGINKKGILLPTAPVGPAIGTMIPVKQDEIEEPPVISAEFDPEFPGGAAAMNKFLIQYLRKDDQWLDMNLSGKVHVQFVVDKEGTVKDVKAIAGPYEILKKTSERAIKAMPKWKPGRMGTRNVSVIMTIPINFIIQ